MRVLLIALLAAISYAQTAAPTTRCSSTTNIYRDENGCEDLTTRHFCNFDDTDATNGDCTPCPAAPDSCGTGPSYNAWESFFSCVASCEITNGTAPEYSEIDETGMSGIIGTKFPHPYCVDKDDCCEAGPNMFCATGAYKENPSASYSDPCSQQECSGTTCEVGILSNSNGESCQLEIPINAQREMQTVQGTCQFGHCVYDDDAEDCAPPQVTSIMQVHRQLCSEGENSHQGSFNTWTCFKSNVLAPCETFGPGLVNFAQNIVSPSIGASVTIGSGTSATAVTVGALFITQWHDSHGRCLIGEQATTAYERNNGAKDECVINQSGSYRIYGLDISYIQRQLIAQEYVSVLISPFLNIVLTPKVYCSSNADCVAQWKHQYENSNYCGADLKICETPSTSHGDPIIWTFDEECYDLNQDGLYVASEAHMFDHTINIAVYNDYMREIQVISRKNGEMMLSLNNLGEVVNNNYPYYFSEQVKDCPPDMPTECPDTYTEFQFDAQDFRYYVQVVRHDYADPGLKEGELGFHLDIYPKPYHRGFNKHKKHYKGLYFENPLPEVLPYCPGGSPRAHLQ